MRPSLAYGGIAVLALLAGIAFWAAGRPDGPAGTTPAATDVSPGVLYATGFRDLDGTPRTLSPYAGKAIVLNFWATWCTPCREEMPSFARLQSRWAAKGVQFVGLASDEAEKVLAFSRENPVNYPLWTGTSDIMELSRRLGNRLGVLPHTVLIGPDGRVLESRIGIYPEKALEQRLKEIAPKSI